VVAHHVSVMGIQAGVARRLFDRDPTEAVTAIGSVETASRQAIADLQQLVGVLRRQEEGDDLAPQPSLGRLPELVEHMRQAGLPVELTVKGRQGPLPAGVELSAYRIVQEALTNTLKHAGPAQATVTVASTPFAEALLPTRHDAIAPTGHRSGSRCASQAAAWPTSSLAPGRSHVRFSTERSARRGTSSRDWAGCGAARTGPNERSTCGRAAP
jgi:hypothetical protein